MLRIGKQQNSIRLPEMTAIPSSDDLQFLLSKAQRNWRCSVELPFKTPDGLAGFIVMVKCEMGTGTPCWSLYRADRPGTPVVWSHVSTDMLLIHNLISLESAGVAQQAGVGEVSFSPDAQPGYSNAPKSEMSLTQSRIMQVPEYASSATQPQMSQNSSLSALTHSRILQPEAPLTQSRVMPAGALDSDEECELDPSLMQSVEWSLKRAETGIFTYPALLYFLHQEHARFQRGGQPFTVVVFDLCAKDGGFMDQLPIPAVREACSRVCGLKRTLDMVAHYEALEYAFLLPHTDAAGGAVFVERVVRALSESPLMPGLSVDSVDFRFGLASIPEDCQKPGQLLAAAAQAKRSARENGRSFISFHELKAA